MIYKKFSWITDLTIFHLISFSDRCRTTNNMLGDCYGAAVVEALSKKELIAMDEAAEKERNKELEGDIESGHETIVKKVKKVIFFQHYIVSI